MSPSVRWLRDGSFSHKGHFVTFLFVLVRGCTPQRNFENDIFSICLLDWPIETTELSRSAERSFRRIKSLEPLILESVFLGKRSINAPS